MSKAGDARLLSFLRVLRLFGLCIEIKSDERAKGDDYERDLPREKGKQQQQTEKEDQGDDNDPCNDEG